LTDLRISENNIGDAEALAFARCLESNTSLRELDLTKTNIGEVGAHAVEQAVVDNPPLTFIRRVQLPQREHRSSPTGKLSAVDPERYAKEDAPENESAYDLVDTTTVGNDDQQGQSSTDESN